MISVYLFPLFLGLTHCLEADHMLAVATVSSSDKKEKKKLFFQGVTWGIGHSIPVVILGLIYALSSIFLLERVTFSLEIPVGIVLILSGLYKLIKRAQKETLKNHLKALLFIGLLHGFAGSGGIVLAHLSDANSLGTQIAYLLIFSVGSILGMGVISMLLVELKQFLDQIQRIQWIIPVLSILYGLYMIYKNV